MNWKGRGRNRSLCDLTCNIQEVFFERAKENLENFSDFSPVFSSRIELRPLEHSVTSGRMALVCVLPSPASLALSLPCLDVLCFIFVFELLTFDVRCAAIVLSHIGMVCWSITSNVNCSAYSSVAGMEIDYLFPWWIRG
jgi:hypothetical protein